MASKRRQRRRVCTRKQQYNKHEAVKIATQMQRIQGTAIDAYYCDLCKHWHVGHRPQKVQQAISARRKFKEKKA